MHKLVEKFIAEKETLLKEQKQKEREAFLIQQGLFVKSRLGENDPVEMYEDAEAEWNEEQQGYVYYGKKAIPVTDEEFERIIELTPGFQKRNKSAIIEIVDYTRKFLSVMSIVIYIVGFIAGIVAGVYTSSEHIGYNAMSESFTAWLAMFIWMVTLSLGSICLGISKLIQLKVHEHTK